MQTFTCTGAIFRHTIAAHDFESAFRVAQSELGGGRVILWATPDVWTRRAIEAAPLPGVVDAVPRFVVERGSSFSDTRELDHDNLPGSLRPGEAEALRQDSPEHAAWLDAFEAVHVGGEALRRHVVDVATCRDVERHKRFVRALAGAYGLGPVPAWHGAILPGLVALDVVADGLGLNVDNTWYESEPLVLVDMARKIAASRRGLGLATVHLIAAVQGADLELCNMRAATALCLSSLGWLPHMTFTQAFQAFAA